MQNDKIIYVRHENFFQIGGTEIERADYDPFEVIDEFYAKDINNVYYNGKVVAAASPNSVDFVASEYSKNTANSGYLISNNKVFCYGEAIEEADPDTFAIISDQFFKDEQYVYYQEHKVVNVKPSNMIIICTLVRTKMVIIA